MMGTTDRSQNDVYLFILNGCALDDILTKQDVTDYQRVDLRALFIQCFCLHLK